MGSIVVSTSQPLNSSDTSNISSLRISIEDPAENPVQPKTDYAFFGADSNSITLGVGQSSEVPFEFSPTLGLIISGFSIGLHQLWKKWKNCQLN